MRRLNHPNGYVDDERDNSGHEQGNPFGPSGIRVELHISEVVERHT